MRMLLEYIKLGIRFIKGEQESFEQKYDEVGKRIEAARKNMNENRGKNK